MKQIKIALAILCAVTLSWSGAAQVRQTSDDVIFGALREELKREMEGLALPGYTSPHYMSYILKETEYAAVTANLGTILSEQYIPRERQVGMGIYTGTYDLNSDAMYQPFYAFTPTVADDDARQIRHDLWLMSDALYKNAASTYQNKVAALARQNESERLPDMLRAEPVTIIDEAGSLDVDRDAMRRAAKELSAVFLEYPELYGTAVMLSAMKHVAYMVNSEGSTVRQPVVIYALSAAAGTDTPEGTEIGNQLAEYYPEGLPPMNELREKIDKLAKQTMEMKNAPVAEEYYYGPVMYEGQAAVATFTYTLLSPKTLLPYRKPVDAQKAVTTLSNRVGRKVMDSRFTIKNLNNIDEYDGKKLIGAYKVDIEGGIPPAEVTLVEKGLFRRTLNSRIPTEISSESTGSLRLGVSTEQGSLDVYPGVLHLSATGTESPESLKQKLIEKAVEQGNDCAYIVRSIGGDPLVYHVDIETGEEQLVRNVTVPAPAFNKLDRLIGISNKEQVVNDQIAGSVPMSLICPAAFVVEDIEITPRETKKERLFFTGNPLKR